MSIDLRNGRDKMFTTTWLRRLRLRHKIPLSAIAGRCGMSVQHLSRIEFGERSTPKSQEEKICKAIEQFIKESREKLCVLEADYCTHREMLLQTMEVEMDD